MSIIENSITTRKIIHVDMDCFYAAVEIRDNPSLADKPVAVGASPKQRGVLCTCNYIARKYGIHSAMPTAMAYRLCKDLIVLPVNMIKYRQVAKNIHAIFHEFTELVEPLSLDEAYLDVSNTIHYQSSATLIAQAIRAKIWDTEKLTASAGVASNKFLAKIASGWKKPNGLFVIHPNDIDNFIKNLSVDELYGVGKVTAEKLHQLGFKTCVDLQKLSLTQLSEKFGKLGKHLYEQCRGIDNRQVVPNRTRKSISVERTFPKDIHNMEICISIVNDLYQRLQQRIAESSSHRSIKNQFIKIKFNDFDLKTAEISCHEIRSEQFIILLRECFMQKNKPVRLLGLGVHFDDENINSFAQQSLF